MSAGAAAFGVMACIYALLLWYHDRLRTQWAKQDHCDHHRGHVVSVDHHLYESAWSLSWVCPDCGLQHVLRDLVALPGKDVFWYTRGNPRWEEAHLRAIREAYELDRGMREHQD
jgi:hypothetical protein